MEGKAEEGGPEKSGKDEAGQVDEKKKDKLQKRLESKVLGMLGRRSGKEDSKDDDRAGPAEAEGKVAGPDEHRGPGTEHEKPPAAADDTGRDDAKDEKAGAGPAPEPPAKGGEKRKRKKAAKAGRTGKQPKKKHEIPKESMDELLSQKEEIEALLSSIEDSYREAMLPDNTYREVKEKNEKKIQEIEEKIEALEAAGEAAPPAEEKPAAAERPVMVEAPARPARMARPAVPAARPAAPAPAARPGGAPPSVPVLDNFEKMIESRMKDVLSAASLEMTDKRIRKVDERLESLESAIKELRKTADTVAGYDRQFTVMNTEVEKAKALVDSLKEAKNVTDEKLQRMAESYAEIRSIVYQREATSKEQEVLLEKLKDTVSQVDTARILREFTTRDEQLRDVNTRIERLERSTKMLSTTMNRIKGLMTDVGSLENIMKASKLAGEKLERMQEMEERMKATSTRLDSAYIDMKRRLDEFTTYKVKQDRLEGMSGDMIKNVEDLTRRLSDYATKDEVDVVKQAINDIKERSKKAAATVELPPEAKLLQEEKEEIETLLATLEENLRNKDISQEEYDNAKSRNLQKIREIDAKIASFSKPVKAKGGKEPQAGAEEEKKQSRAMLLAKLRESYENGVISRDAYEKSKKLLLKK